MPATIPMREMREIQLEGERLPVSTPNLELINQVGLRLYQQNQALIMREIPADWFTVIEPVSGKLIAAPSVADLYHYTSEQYPNKLLFILGNTRNRSCRH